MPLVYLDFIKLTLPADVRQHVKSTHAQYAVFGSYDLLYYKFPKGVEEERFDWLEYQHEERHTIDWNYERHPLFIYSSGVSQNKLEYVLNPKSLPSCPLVLTMARMVKHPLTSNAYAPTLDSVLESLQKNIDGLQSQESRFPSVACWDLGNADFVIVSRPKTLVQLRDLFIKLECAEFKVNYTKRRSIKTRLCSFSSHAAFPFLDGSEQYVNKEDLESWLNNDRELDFIDFVDVQPNGSFDISYYKNSHFLFGDRDFQFIKSIESKHKKDSTEAIIHVMAEMLDPGSDSAIQSSSLIPNISMEGCQDSLQDALDNNAFEDTPVYNLNWEAIEGTMDLVAASFIQLRDSVAKEFDDLNREKTAREQYLRLIDHCINTLYALYYHAIRLYASAFQDDVLHVIRNLYDSLADVIDAYYDVIEAQEQGSVETFTRAVPGISEKVMVFVSELQHIYTVLAVSPHSYMETYYGSMRSLNAASKLWVSYSGVANALCDLFPVSRVDINSGEIEWRSCKVLITPYREKSSKSQQIFPQIESKSILVLMQLNYPMMFNTSRTIFVISHELGHYIFNTTRDTRAKLILRTIVSQLIINKSMIDTINYPLFYLSNAWDYTINRSTVKQRLTEYEECLEDEKQSKKWLCLNICNDYSAKTYRRIYNELVKILRDKYNEVIEEEINSIVQGFESYYNQCIRNNTSLSYCYGRDAISIIVSYIERNIKSTIVKIQTRIVAENVEFLNNISSTENRYKGLKIEFNRYQIVRLRTYWEERYNNGFGGSDFHTNTQSIFKQQCEMLLDLFREMHADIFACKTIGYEFEDYINHVSSFVESDPELIAAERDLVRIMVVSEAALVDKECKKLREWLQNDKECLYENKVRLIALNNMNNIQNGIYYQNMLQYGIAVCKSIDKQIDNIKKNPRDRALYKSIKDYAAGYNHTQSMWKFWLYAMRNRDEI